MPTRMLTLSIVGFWLVMTTCLVKKDLLPAAGYGDLDYRQVLVDHVIGQQTRWQVDVDGKKVGIITGMITRRASDGVAILVSRGIFDSPIFGQIFNGASSIRVSNEIHVSPLGSLLSLSSDLFVDGVELKIHLEGVVEGDELVLKLTGLPIFGNELRLPIDRQALMAQSGASLDRLTNLRVGKAWITRSINPLPTFGAASPVTEIRNRVVALEDRPWNDDAIPCFRIEHVHPSLTASTWVRASDGVILVQQIPFAGFVLTLTRDESLDDL